MEQGSIGKDTGPCLATGQHDATIVTPDLVRYSRGEVVYHGPRQYRGVEVIRLCGFRSDATILAERPASDDHSMLLLTRGSGKQMEAEFAGKRYSASGNRELRASFLPENADAWMEFNPAARGVTIRFPPAFLAQYLDPAARNNLAPLIFDGSPSLIGLITMLDLAITHPDAAQDVIADQIMRSIALILAGIDPNGLVATRGRIALPANRVRRVIDFIEAHLHERLTLDTLADIVGLSPFHFARAFKDTTGVSPYRYVCDRRLLKAQRMLIAGQGPLGEVARACGFGSPSHFSAAFTRSRQMSPREYRSQFGFT